MTDTDKLGICKSEMWMAIDNLEVSVKNHSEDYLKAASANLGYARHAIKDMPRHTWLNRMIGNARHDLEFLIGYGPSYAGQVEMLGTLKAIASAASSEYRISDHK